MSSAGRINVRMQLPSCRSCHALLGHHIVAVAKSVSSKAYGPSPGAKQSCSNLTGRHRPSAICSNAVRAKLPVENRSNVIKSLSTHLEVLYPQCRCISTERTMCAGFAARGRSGLQGRELHWSAPVKLSAVQSSGSEAGPTSPIKPPQELRLAMYLESSCKERL